MQHGHLDSATMQRIRAVAAAHADQRGPLLPILRALQAEFGYIDRAAVPVLADILNLSTAEVHGVVTFYRDFRHEPPGRTTVRVCRAEACQSVGADHILEHAEATLGTKVGGTTEDGAVTLDEVFCLGNCALGPTVAVGDRMHGRVSPARFDALLGELR